MTSDAHEFIQFVKGKAMGKTEVAGGDAGNAGSGGNDGSGKDRLSWKDPEAIIALVALAGVVFLVIWLAGFVGDIEDVDQRWARALQVANGPGASFLLILGGILGFAVQSPRIKSEAQAKDEAKDEAAQAKQEADSALAKEEEAKKGILEIRTAAEEMVASRANDLTTFIGAPTKPLGRYLVESEIPQPDSDTVDRMVVADEGDAKEMDPSLSRLLERISSVEQRLV